MNDSTAGHEPADETGLLGAADIVTAFTALRHELKLQVRAGRDLADRLGRLEAAVIAGVRPPPPAPGDQLRRLAGGLAEMEESLERATVAVAEQAERLSLAGVEAGEDATSGVADDAALADERRPDPAAAWNDCLERSPRLLRLLAAGLTERLGRVFDEAIAEATAAGQRSTEAATEAVAGAATALADAGQGLELLLVRTRRLMNQAGIRRIDVVDEPFDPERMRAIDVVEDTNVPEGHVAAQYRPGYLLDDTVLRPAEVRVAR